MKDIRDLLIFSLDNDLSTGDKNRLDKALRDNPELKLERDKLLKMRELLSGFSISENKDFSQNVMLELEQIKGKKHPNFSVKFIQLFPKVAAACIVLLMVAFSLVHFSDSNLTPEKVAGVEIVNLEDALAYLDN